MDKPRYNSETHFHLEFKAHADTLIPSEHFDRAWYGIQLRINKVDRDWLMPGWVTEEVFDEQPVHGKPYVTGTLKGEVYGLESSVEEVESLLLDNGFEIDELEEDWHYFYY